MKEEDNDFLVNIVNDTLPFSEASDAKILIGVAVMLLVVAVGVWWFRRR